MVLLSQTMSIKVYQLSAKLVSQLVTLKQVLADQPYLWQGDDCTLHS